MAPPSAGYKEFFPNAPRAARDKANERERERERSTRISDSPADRDSRTTTPTNNPNINHTHTHTHTHTHNHRDGLKHDSSSLSANAAHLPTDDNESLQGDIRNGAGSASSHASTVSSGFSASTNNAPAASWNASSYSANNNNNNLTPLTNFSSPAHPSNLPSGKMNASAPPQPGPTNSTTASSQPPRFAERPPARDPNLPVKGIKCIHDPLTDKTLTPADKKAMKPKYQDFGSVRNQYNIRGKGGGVI